MLDIGDRVQIDTSRKGVLQTVVNGVAVVKLDDDGDLLKIPVEKLEPLSIQEEAVMMTKLEVAQVVCDILDEAKLDIMDRIFGHRKYDRVDK